MHWTTQTLGYSGGGQTVHHMDPDGRTRLSVDHDPAANVANGQPTHRIGIGGGGASEYGLMYPSGSRPGAAYLHGPGLNNYGPAPSQELRELIERHHEHAGNTGAWAALLDKVAEEYPDLEPAVSAHTAARYRHDS